MPWHRTDQPSAQARSPAPRPVVVDGRALVLAASEGRWHAIEDRCSHAGCAFSDDGEVDGFHVICNCHGSEFDVRTGHPVRGPATTPIATFSVRVVDGMIEVHV